MNFLGIDVGTGGSRAVLINENGKIMASATVEHVPFASPRIGWAEQSPEDWWRASAEAIRKVLSDDNIRAEEISAISFSGQMHGLILLDEKDVVLRPALIWCDQRTESQCQSLNKIIGAKRMIELVCNPAVTGFTLPKLLWIRENEPEIWEKTKSILLPKDYVRLCLTGEKATDVSDASGTLLFDVKKRNWSDEMLETLGINRSLLPPAFESVEITGKVSESGAAATGLKAGTLVIAGAGDNAAGAVGMGIVNTGTVSVTIGTSGVVFVVTEKPTLDLKGRTHTLCHAVSGRWHMTGVTQGAGLSLRWFRDNFSEGKNYDDLISEVDKIPAGANGLLWLPYLMGERTPHMDANARAAFVGLTASHTRAHLVRAVLEGVAFSLRDSLEIFQELGAPVNIIRLGGGGAHSAVWRQIQSDVYGQIVETITADEGAAFGAAILAGVGAGAWKSVDEACAQVVKTSERITPKKKSAELMNRQYVIYKTIYPALKTANELIARL